MNWHPDLNTDNGYVLLMIGTNDVGLGYKLNSTDTPNVQTRLGGLISSIRAGAEGPPNCCPDYAEHRQYGRGRTSAAIQQGLWRPR